LPDRTGSKAAKIFSKKKGGGARAMLAHDYGAMGDVLKSVTPRENMLRSIDRDFAEQFPDVVERIKADVRGGRTLDLRKSAGPIADAYQWAADPVVLIVGPGASGKTTASVKKCITEGQRIHPGPNGVRRYVLGVWRQKYVNLWKATIPSWWSLLPRDLKGSRWFGAPPRDATQIVRFEDVFGRVEIEVRFRAFGDTADPEDILGNEFTDCYFNEWPTLPEELFIALGDRVGRTPPPMVIKRQGCFFGDGNAPDVLNYCYRDFYENLKPGYRLFRQPGGLHPLAENLEAMGRGYYEQSAFLNQHRQWWVRRMVHALPGFTRANDPVYPTFDDVRNIASSTLRAFPELPVLVGIDGGLTPAAVYGQELSNGQARILAEIALERGGMRELATAMLALEARLFRDCNFVAICDPSMTAGEDTEDSSDRARLAEYLAREVMASPTNDPDLRFEGVRAKLRHTVDDGQPGLLIDPACKGLRRGFNQTFAFRNISGTNERGNVQKTFDSHVHDALQYLAQLFGTEAARRLVIDLEREREKRRQENREAPRYSPFRRRIGR
jgi:hypothetical protein